MNNDLQMTIAYARVKFTRKEHQIADYLLANPVPDKIDQLAKQIDVSASSLTRFTKKLGFSSFKEFYYRYQQQLNEKTPFTADEQHSALHHEYVNIIHRVYELLDGNTAEKLSQDIHSRPGFHVFGAGFSTLVAQDLKLRFRRLGKFVDIIADVDSMDMYGPLLQAGDLLLVISLNGRNERLVKYLHTLKERGVTLVCMTSDKKSRMAVLADYVLLTSSLHGEESTGMISAQLPLLMAVDFLYCRYITLFRDSIDTWMETEKNYLLPKKPE
ncbi:MurR/RpiR family transcriptional regulator [Vibrio gazogenes]|uniref:Transcriptional regulator, RpiR family n=1 Tax=Vibrio gazogenes DSM 21264 = NBRC 103151 TaxID=1123492 RepID=A0A1M4YWS2_VIBGA|nr:MurR/RpiR family transcriptional regulator [Vibrio gazogenes]USP15128.1 MurR/RpiR family transcriptional regulator [Vibrio gazogenes]SHF10274.1 transcriptional regulator, RpiR family [Vibrio gazogenes DSM 21264] [Vibrio gazogenes DSM 21264 = NBRC 103151]SJN58366.1 HTH-type transcriptional regulator MurR [Vibrio gazogenes]